MSINSNESMKTALLQSQILPDCLTFSVVAQVIKLHLQQMSHDVDAAYQPLPFHPDSAAVPALPCPQGQLCIQQLLYLLISCLKLL